MTLFIAFLIGLLIGGTSKPYEPEKPNKLSLPPIQPKRKIKNS